MLRHEHETRTKIVATLGPATWDEPMLSAILDAGVLRGVRAVAIGQMVGCAAPEGADWSVRDVLVEKLEPLGVPILGDLPIGHGPANRAWVFGRVVRMSRSELAEVEPSALVVGAQRRAAVGLL